VRWKRRRFDPDLFKEAFVSRQRLLLLFLRTVPRNLAAHSGLITGRIGNFSTTQAQPGIQV